VLSGVVVFVAVVNESLGGVECRGIGAATNVDDTAVDDRLMALLNIDGMEKERR
jgi:hypothetical protein